MFFVPIFILVWYYTNFLRTRYERICWLYVKLSQTSNDISLPLQYVWKHLSWFIATWLKKLGKSVMLRNNMKCGDHLIYWAGCKKTLILKLTFLKIFFWSGTFAAYYWKIKLVASENSDQDTTEFIAKIQIIYSKMNFMAVVIPVHAVLTTSKRTSTISSYILRKFKAIILCNNQWIVTMGQIASREWHGSIV